MNIKKMYCPFCDKEHNITMKETYSECYIKNEKIEYIEINYYCDNYDEEFADGKLIDQNLQRARDQYRIKHKLLTSFQIKELREKYKLSQSDLSLILGWGEITITRYETKEIQNENYDIVLRSLIDNPYKLYDYFLINKDKFSNKKQLTIVKKIFSVAPNIEETNKYIEESLNKKHFAIKEIDRGKQEIKFDRILAVIKALLDRGIELYKTKLAKLLWYIDIINYKENKQSITGLAYYHMNYGACPLGLDLILDSKSITIEEIEDNEYVKYLIKNVMIDYKLSDDELKTIDIVVNKFYSFTSKDIVKYMHKEKAYLETKTNEFISFEYAKYIDLR